jgi:hypothetical protein
LLCVAANVASPPNADFPLTQLAAKTGGAAHRADVLIFVKSMIYIQGQLLNSFQDAKGITLTAKTLPSVSDISRKVVRRAHLRTSSGWSSHADDIVNCPDRHVVVGQNRRRLVPLGGLPSHPQRRLKAGLTMRCCQMAV